MKKKKIKLLMFCGATLVFCGCWQSRMPSLDRIEVSEAVGESEIYTENVEMELTEQEENIGSFDREAFEILLAEATTETIVEMVVEDFDNNGQPEAFAITANPEMYARFLVDPESTEGCMTSSFWYLSTDGCTNIYFEDKDAFLTLEYGVLNDEIKYVMVEDWGSAHYSYDSLYTVENNGYKLMFTLPSIMVNEDGTISSYSGTYSNQGYVEDVSIYAYIDGELVKIIE